MRVVVHVDPTRCRGHGICVLYFKDGLELDRWGYARAVDPPPHGRRDIARARHAARACPNGAISYEVVDMRTDGSLQPW